MSIPTVEQWKRGLEISQQIAALQKELATILGKQSATAPAKSGKATGGKPAKARRKNKISPEGRARIAAAQKARWAKVKAGKKS